VAIFVGIVLGAEPDLILFDIQDTLITDGDTVAVSGQIPQDSSGMRQTWLAVHHPIGVYQSVHDVIDVTGAAHTMECTGFGALPEQADHAPAEVQSQ
jgi:hypothetical protein